MKLQLHQHSFLIRKVFSRHNLSAQVFFSVSSGSSLSPHHLQVIFICIWIITWFGSSSLDLDHLWFWNISIGSSSQVLSLDSSHHRKFYRASPFHVGCRPSLHVGLLQCLYMTLSQNGPPNTHIWPCGNQCHNPVRKAQNSHLTHVKNQSNIHVKKGSALIFDTCEEPIQNPC